MQAGPKDFKDGVDDDLESINAVLLNPNIAIDKSPAKYKPD